MLDGPRRDAAEAPARQLVVLLHGYGADGGDLVPLTDEWGGALPHAAFAAPDAPEPHPALAVGRQWFRLVEASLDLTDARLVAAVSAVAEAVNTFANAELARLSLPSDAVAFAGFSQGATVALEAGLSRTRGCAGVLAYSGALAGCHHLPDAHRRRCFCAMASRIMSCRRCSCRLLPSPLARRESRPTRSWFRACNMVSMPVAWTLAQRFWPACLLRWDDAGLPRMGLATVLAKCHRIGRVGEDVVLGFVHENCQLGHLGPELVGDLAPLGLRAVGVLLGCVDTHQVQLLIQPIARDLALAGVRQRNGDRCSLIEEDHLQFSAVRNGARHPPPLLFRRVAELMVLRICMDGAVVHRFDQTVIDRVAESGIDDRIHERLESFSKYDDLLRLVLIAGQHGQHPFCARARIDPRVVRKAGAQMPQKADFDQRSSDAWVPRVGVNNAAAPNSVATDGTIEFCRKNERSSRRNPADCRNIRVCSDPSPFLPTLHPPV